MEKEKQIYCSDCAICAGIAKQNAHGKWTLWGVSEVLGMGNALFEKRPFTDEFDNVEPFNTMDGTSYIAVCKGGLWGLIQVKFKDKTRISEDSWEWKWWIEDLKCKSLEEVQSLIKIFYNMIYGYSERGIFNSIIYYLDAHQEMIGEFLTCIGVNKGFNHENYDFVFLNEQSFSDFGDNDLTIIITKKCSQEKTVLFIEGKVKTSSGVYDLKNHFDKIHKDKLYEGVSSNIFAQLYYKFLLTNIQGPDFEIKDCVIGKPTKKLGNNKIVKFAFENYIKDTQEYYYIAIFPEKVGNETFKKYFNDLNLNMPLDRIISTYWGTIQDFFTKNVAIQVIKNFDYNEGQIY